jgi:hypothetical protein
MTTTLLRPDRAVARCFPPVATLLVEPPAPDPPDLAADQQTARRMLDLGTKKLSLLQRHGWRCAGSVPVSRLLRWHREALRAEVQGQPQRARFFWQEMHRALAQLPPEHDAWTQMCVECGAAPTTAEPWRRHLVREVLFETHLALCNHYLQQGQQAHAVGQADQHLLWLDSLLSPAQYTAAEQRSFREAIGDSGPWKVGDRVLGQWSDGFWYTGHVNQLRGDQLAIAFDDGDHAWLTAGQVRAIDLDVGSRVQGNWKQRGYFYPGRITKKQGDRFHVKYDDNDEEWTTVRWLRVKRDLALPTPTLRAPVLVAAPDGQPIPPLKCKPPVALGDHGPFDQWLLSRRDRLLKLMLAATILLAVVLGWQGQRNAATHQQRDAAYRDAMAAAERGDEQTALAAADRFLSVAPSPSDPRWRHLQKIQQAARQHQRDLVYAQLADAFQKKDEQEVARAANAFLSLAMKSDDPRTSQVKELAAAAEQWPQLRQRDAAYAQLHAAFPKGNDQGMLSAAKAFEEALSTSLADPRADQVQKLAAQAKEWPLWKQRDEAYAVLRSSSRRSNVLAILKAAEQFLESLPLQGIDPRTSEVLNVYHRVFHDWYLAQTRAELRRSGCVAAYLKLSAIVPS